MLAVTKEPIFHKQNASPSDGIASTTLLVLWLTERGLGFRLVQQAGLATKVDLKCVHVKESEHK